MIALALQLRARGVTYESNGSLYFHIDAFEPYGKLAQLDRQQIRVGARVDSDEYEKEDARDFVLWKCRREGEPHWDSPFGAGRPGWHLECSAMSIKYLGEQFDLHTGGVDNIFPHHENEIAQSEGATGKPFVRFWIHPEFLLVEGEKMAKSKGNQFTVRNLEEEGFSPVGIRYLLFSAHYRKQLNFSREGIRQAAQAIRRVDDLLERLGEVQSDGPLSESVQDMTRRARGAFEEAMDDDLNTPVALGALFDLVREANRALSSSSLTKEDAGEIAGTIERLNSVFGVFGQTEAVMLDADVEKLITERREARARRDFARSDAIRDELDAQGIVLEDTPAGTRWRRK